MTDKRGMEKWRQPYAPNPAMLRLEMEREGYRVYQWCDRPGTVYGSHFHAEAQTHWVVSGSIEISLEGSGTYQLSAGDRDFVPANARHTACVVGDESVVYLVGEKLPEKPKRGRPKKKKETQPGEELPWELKVMLGIVE